MIYIYGAQHSNFVRSVQIACALKGLDCEVAYHLGGEEIPFRSDKHLAIHPFAKLPVIQDGTVRVAESQAILRYLDAAYPEPALQPETILERAEHDSWCSHIASNIDQALIRKFMVEFVFPTGENGEPNYPKMLENKPSAENAISVIETRLSQADFICGNKPTLADCLLAPLADYSARLTESLSLVDDNSAINTYLERMMSLEGITEILR